MLGLLIKRKMVGTMSGKISFLTFVHAENGTTVDALTTQFLDALSKIGLPVDKMRAQGYDGASVMSGNINGVQTSITSIAVPTC